MTSEPPLLSHLRHGKKVRPSATQGTKSATGDSDLVETKAHVGGMWFRVVSEARSPATCVGLGFAKQSCTDKAAQESVCPRIPREGWIYTPKNMSGERWGRGPGPHPQGRRPISRGLARIFAVKKGAAGVTPPTGERVCGGRGGCIAKGSSA